MRTLNGTKWARKHNQYNYVPLSADVKGDVVTLCMENPNAVTIRDSENNIHHLGRFEFWENFELLFDDDVEFPIEFDTSIGKMLFGEGRKRKDDTI